MLPSTEGDVVDIITRLVTSASFNTVRFYDLQLDHWGFSRRKLESFRTMHDRLREPIQKWWYSDHNGFKDNGIEGVKKLNHLAGQPSEDTYYFTMSFDATRAFPKVNISADDIKTFPLHPGLSLGGSTIPGLWDIGAHAVSGFLGVVHSVFNAIPGNPDDVDFAKWIVRVLNNHAEALGYFSRIPSPGDRIPRSDMLPILSIFSYAMSGMDVSSAPFPSTELNDGVVNTRSMRGPKEEQIKEIAEFQEFTKGNIKKAKKWYWHLGTNQTMDHADQIGVFTDDRTVSILTIVPHTTCCPKHKANISQFSVSRS